LHCRPTTEKYRPPKVKEEGKSETCKSEGTTSAVVRNKGEGEWLIKRHREETDCAVLCDDHSAKRGGWGSQGKKTSKQGPAKALKYHDGVNVK